MTDDNFVNIGALFTMFVMINRVGARSGVAEHGPHHLPKAKGKSAVSVRRAMVDVAIFVLIAILDPFGVVGWSEMRSHDIWQRINADTYPSTALSLGFGHEDAKHSPSPARDAITVVYFDDASVKRQYGTTAMTSFALLDLIDDIALTPSAQPKAIFIDMVLDDAGPEGIGLAQYLGDALGDVTNPSTYAAQCARRPVHAGISQVSPFRCLVIRIAQLTKYQQWHGRRECQDGTLGKLKCIRNAGGLPLFFADVRTQLQKDRRFDDLLGSAASEALGTVAALSPATIDVAAYPLVTPEKAADRTEVPFQLYPAAALYAVWCLDHPCRPSPIESDASGRPAWSSRYETPLQVAWGIGPGITGSIDDPTHLLAHRQTDGGAETIAEHCTPAAPGRWADLVHVVRMSLGGLLTDQAPCLYQRAVPSDVFQSAAFSQKDADGLIARKLVLVGAQFRASTDYVSAVPFGAVPGVYLHSMALDNLIEGGQHYQHEPSKVLGHFATSDILNVIVLFFVSYILARARIAFKAIDEEEVRGVPLPRPHMRRLRILLVAAGCTLALWIIILAVARLPVVSVRILPDNINAAAAMLFALFGLLDLTLEALKPLATSISARSAVAIDAMLHGARSVRGAPAVAHGNPVEDTRTDPSTQNGG